jgi:hypothetical protein
MRTLEGKERNMKVIIFHPRDLCQGWPILREYRTETQRPYEWKYLSQPSRDPWQPGPYLRVGRDSKLRRQADVRHPAFRGEGH